MIPRSDQRIVMVTGLGFGYANVVVAVPQAWIDVRNMADLDDVATAFRRCGMSARCGSPPNTPT